MQGNKKRVERAWAPLRELGCWGCSHPQPAISLKGEGKSGDPGLVARKTPRLFPWSRKNGGGDGGGVVGSGLGRDSGLSTLTLALSLPGRGNTTAAPLKGRGVAKVSREEGKMGGWWGWCGVVHLSVGGGAGSHPHPALSLKETFA